MSRDRNAGQALADLLASKLRTEGRTVSEIARRLGISQGYLSQLLNGDKEFAGVSDEFIRRCAEFLSLPVVVCFLLAGRLSAQDFFEAPCEFSRYVEKALRTIANSRYAMEAAVTYRQLASAPPQMQRLIVLLYETASKTELIPGRVKWNSVETFGKPRVPFRVRVVKPK